MLEANKEELTEEQVLAAWGEGVAERACWTCRHWNGNRRAKDVEAEGDCHRHSPTIEIQRFDDDVVCFAWWPPTRTYDWCAEYQEGKPTGRARDDASKNSA